MKNIILFDNEYRNALLPLAYTRPIGEFRVGITTIRQKWEQYLNGQVSYMVPEYLAAKFPVTIEEDNYLIDGGVIPTPELAHLVKQLSVNEALMSGSDFLAARVTRTQMLRLMNSENIDSLDGIEVEDTPFLKINHLWDIFRYNQVALQLDFVRLTQNRNSAPLSDTNQVINKHQVFLEEGATVENSVLNATDGPIYIGKSATIMDGCLIRGDFALGDYATLKMGAKIYGPTTIGPYSKVGGEVKNSVLFGFSNKSHDGYLGNSVIGEWCNLGANTNNSNMKNNYSNVKVWNYKQGKYTDSGEQFCGTFMGDHVKCGINTMLNTGTVVGVFANIFGAGFPDKFVPSFSWGAAEEQATFRLDKALEVAARVFARRGKKLDVVEENLIKYVFEASKKHRLWEMGTPVKNGIAG